MWPTIAIVAIGIAAVLGGLWWRSRRGRLESEARAGRRIRELEDEIGSLKDNTGRRLHRHQVFLESMSDGVMLVDAEGRIELVNAAFTRMFALPPEVIGRQAEDTLRLPEFIRLLRRAHEGGGVLDAEIELPGVDHRLVQVSVTAMRETKGRTSGLVVLVHDLTRLKQLENTRRDFVANVSHELRTPLSLIKGFVETLLLGGPHDAETVERFLKTIQKHADRLAFLIEDLLTISKLESGALAMHLEPLPLRPLVDHVLEDLQGRQRSRTVRLENGIAAGLEVRGDADRLQQVFSNLIDNAIKYGRKDGRVEIGARRINGKWIEVWIRDDGPGIPPEALNRIYERFYRVDKARSREQGGTGLGLAIVKHIVQSHGGEVCTESEIGRGTVFRLTLPAAPIPTGDPASAIPTKPASPPEPPVN
ncbi:MAG: PAS domain-containing protein [Verrucomicrobiales bacterium]|nr:PAS domain-containing protein [Verrucomicrobiales bacterium]